MSAPKLSEQQMFDLQVRLCREFIAENAAGDGTVGFPVSGDSIATNKHGMAEVAALVFVSGPRAWSDLAEDRLSAWTASLERSGDL